MERPSRLDRLRAIFQELVAQGAHNIDLVNPTHFAHVVAQALEAPLPIPVVWNTGGYDRVETLQALEGKIDIYLPDYKYPDPQGAKAYAGAADYPAVAQAAIQEMAAPNRALPAGRGWPAPAGGGDPPPPPPRTAGPGQGGYGLGGGDTSPRGRFSFPS